MAYFATLIAVVLYRILLGKLIYLYPRSEGYDVVKDISGLVIGMLVLAVMF